MELLTKIIQSNELLSSLDRIANEKSMGGNTDLNDHNDIHILARRVLTLLEEFKNNRSFTATMEDGRRSSLGQKQR